jgi:hypothetical protein|tara:strand:+ start:393 stop:566 length:174 start_codon:yes stop_codon:yes gene_type:complete
MENIGMFIMGSVVCGLYLTGYLYMIKYANDSHDKAIKGDKEKAKRKLSASDDKILKE